MRVLAAARAVRELAPVPSTPTEMSARSRRTETVPSPWKRRNGVSAPGSGAVAPFAVATRGTGSCVAGRSATAPAITAAPATTASGVR